jgi:uncharacterized membrane protein
MTIGTSASRIARAGATTLLFLCALAAAGRPADARPTGGSMGGGSWGHSSSSSSGYSGGYSSHSSSSSSYYSGSSSSGGGDLGVTMVAFAVLMGIYIIAAVLKSPGSQGLYVPPDSDQVDGSLHLNIDRSGGDAADVSVLRIAIDGRARKFLQTELVRISQTADTATDTGRLTMLREVALLLRRVRDAWVYGGAVNEPMRELGGAKAAFDGHVLDARARFEHELVRNEQGVQTTAATPELTAHSVDGPGLVLVSLIVAARHELMTVQRIGDGEQLRQALDALSNRSASDLVAVEIVWQPAADEDRMSSVALEAAYPRPDLIPLPGSMVGKVFCAYCSGPFPAELVSCPHCGAPAPHAAAERAAKAG